MQLVGAGRLVCHPMTNATTSWFPALMVGEELESRQKRQRGDPVSFVVRQRLRGVHPPSSSGLRLRSDPCVSLRAQSTQCTSTPAVAHRAQRVSVVEGELSPIQLTKESLGPRPSLSSIWPRLLGCTVVWTIGRLYRTIQSHHSTGSLSERVGVCARR